jgi:16S rRNA (cytosine967-C5)-methyltransferase
MFVPAYLKSVQEILSQYKGEEPLHSFLKKYFSLNKKFGSRDRKQIVHLCYCFFRLGKSLMDISIEKKLPLGVFLCDKEKNILLQKLDPLLNEEVDRNLNNKILKLKELYNFQEEDIFAFHKELSEEINFKNFSLSFLKQPGVYLRIRPGNKKQVLEKFTRANILYQRIDEDCIVVEPATKLDDLLEVNKEAVIQDINSQKVFQALFETVSVGQIKTAWDCCAASGGKSILLKDHLPAIELTVSDVRESILLNLEKRFKQAGIKNYRKLIIDLSKNSFPGKEQFDLIICDAPCSGSGTWSRTPEQLYFFTNEKIEYYATLQKKIIANAIKNLKTGGHFVYITCSVFKKENEEVVQYAQTSLGLKLLNKTYLKGYYDRADTLFTALFTSIS